MLMNDTIKIQEVTAVFDAWEDDGDGPYRIGIQVDILCHDPSGDEYVGQIWFTVEQAKLMLHPDTKVIGYYREGNTTIPKGSTTVGELGQAQTI